MPLLPCSIRNALTEVSTGICPQNNYVTYANKSYECVGSLERVQQSRTYPENPLLSPTPQGEAWRSVSRWQVEKKTLFFNETCNGKAYVQTRKRIYYAYTNTHFVSLPRAVNDYITSEEQWRTQLLLKMLAYRQGIGVDLAEWQQTAGMFFDFVGKVRGLLKAAKAKHNRKEKLCKQIADVGLLGEFGIRPLAIALAEAVPRTFDNLLERNETIYHAKAFQNIDVNIEDGGFQYTGFAKVKASAYLKPDLSGLESGNFYIENPANLAWELLPYSWIIDYAVNVGDTLKAIDGIRGWVYGAGTNSMRLMIRRVRLTPYVAGYTVETRGKATYRSHSRQAFDPLALIPNGVRFNPGFAEDVLKSLRRVADMTFTLRGLCFEFS